MLDTKTNLMWAAEDNGKDINWHDAKKYCENYRGGGYTDWRMPTRDELLTLYDGNATERDMACGFYVKMATDLIQMTCSQFWASDEGVPGSRAAAVHLSDGFPTFFRPSDFLSVRFLPVRRDN